MDGLIIGIFVGMFVMLVMALIAMRLTSKGYVPKREVTKNRAGGATDEYTPERNKLLW